MEKSNVKNKERKMEEIIVIIFEELLEA